MLFENIFLITLCKNNFVCDKSEVIFANLYTDDESKFKRLDFQLLQFVLNLMMI